MSVAAAQYGRFKQQVVADGLVWTLTEDDDFLVFPVRDGEAVPFWSSQSRLEKLCSYHPKYTRYQKISLPLAEFLELLPRLQSEKVSIGVNWSGERLAGYNVSAESLLAGLQIYMAKREGSDVP